MDRRSFINSTLLLAGTLVVPAIAGGRAAGDTGSELGTDAGEHPGKGCALMPHKLPDLPYAYDALEPFLSAETLHLHHDKHHAGYVNALNETEEKLKKAQSRADFSAIRPLCDALAFNYSGHLLHSLFWTNMSPNGGGKPSGTLADAIAAAFGSYDTFHAQFLAATNAVQGSGWGILAWQPMGEQLVILQAEKHQNMAEWGATPVLVLDVWEHAYYLQYQNRRTEFTAKFFDVVNWADVAQRLERAKA